MPERDFDEEFGQIMASEFAHEDAELVTFYKNRMFGNGSDHYPGEQQFVHGLMRYEYLMSKPDLQKAVGKCVGKMAGIQTGKEFFSDKT